MNLIVKRITELRTERNLTITKLCKLAGVAPNTIYRMRSKEIGDISLRLLMKICLGLGITMTEFFDVEYLGAPKKSEPVCEPEPVLSEEEAKAKAYASRFDVVFVERARRPRGDENL